MEVGLKPKGNGILCVGRTYIDVTFVTDAMPTGDEKAVADDYSISLGGNAVVAGLCLARLGSPVDIMTTIAMDMPGMMAMQEFARYDVGVIPRSVGRSAVSLVHPHDGMRSILRCRDEQFLCSFPIFGVEGYDAAHFDGHQPDAALHYAKLCRERGILTSLDGGGVRDRTDDLLELVDVAVVSERFCEQKGFKGRYHEALRHLRAKGCVVGAVTCGKEGILYYEGDSSIRHIPAIPVDDGLVVDTNGAGDIFHGAYLYSFTRNRSAHWEHHFRFAAAASAHSVQYLGIENSLPTLQHVQEVLERHGLAAA